MQTKSTISRQLLLLVLAFLLFSAAIALIYQRALTRLAAQSCDLVDESIDRLSFSLRLMDTLTTTQNALQKLLRKSNPDEVERLTQQHAQREDLLRRDVARCGQAAQSVIASLEAWAAASRSVIGTFLRGNTADAHYQFVTKTTERYEQVVAQLHVVQVTIRGSIRSRSTQYARDAEALRTRMLTGVCIAIAALLAFAMLFRRRIVRLAVLRAQLEASNKAIQAEVDRQTGELRRVHKQLLDIARQAGMAEVATDVLHNVGNVLNSVNVSASVVAEKVQHSRVKHLAQAAQLIRDHSDHLGEFLTSNQQGRQLPAFLCQLSDHLTGETTFIENELASLSRHIEHIKEIVSTQQAYARAAGVIESVHLSELIEDALRINLAGLNRHEVEIVRQFATLPTISADKHKILQILVNLISNAKYAMEGSRAKKILIRTELPAPDCVRVSVTDTGVGIPAENLTRVFSHGFTTRKHGHGFGLHSSALAARDMKGSLTVHSDGPGRGATFTLELPVSAALETRSTVYGSDKR